MNANRMIVVGVDGSEHSRSALQWAMSEAHLRGAAVQAVTAWGPENYPAALESQAAAERLLAHEIQALPAFHRNGAAIATEVVEGRPADVLSAAARDAELLVVGGHGHNPAWHAVLGAVSDECIRKATCPVVVIPDRYEQPVEPTTKAVAGR